MPLSDITNKPHKKTKELSEFERGRICGLSVFGELNNAEISRRMDIPRTTVSGIVNAYKRDGQTTVKQRPGRPKKLSERAENHLNILVRREPFEPLGIHKDNLAKITGPISITTVRKALRKSGFSSFRPLQQPFLSVRHKKKRREWVSSKMNWTFKDWSKVIWSDESRFALRHNDGGVRVIRKKGERYHSKFGKGSVMVWGCFWSGGLGPLVTLKGSVDQDKYVDCLSQKFLPWLDELKEKHGQDFIFQEDGAPCHTGSYTRWWKEKAHIKGFEFWPAQSPDLNPIENLWRLLGQRIAKRRAQLNNLDELWKAIHEEWWGLGDEVGVKLVESMPEKCAAVKKAFGGNTKY